MAFDDRYTVISDLATLGSRRRPGRPIEQVHFVVAHDTGNSGASARNHARWYRNDPNPPGSRVSSAHLFVDDRDIIETIPALNGPPEQALHVLYSTPTDNQLFGHDANRAAIGIEYCFGGDIDANEAYARYVWVIALTCKRFKIDPARRVTGHQVLDPGRKVDPGQGLGRSGRSFEGLLRDVVAVYGGSGGLVAGMPPSPRGAMRATVRLYRRDRPHRDGAPVGILMPGEQVEVRDVEPGELVAGIDVWCILADGSYCWSGGLA